MLCAQSLRRWLGRSRSDIQERSHVVLSAYLGWTQVPMDRETGEVVGQIKHSSQSMGQLMHDP